MAASETAPRRRRRAAAAAEPVAAAPPSPNALIASAALLASGIKLEPGNRLQASRYKKQAQEWQRYAWDYYETLPPIHYAHDYYGNVVSRVRLYAGYQGDPDEPPVPLDDLDAADSELPEGLDRTLGQAAVDAMARLDAGADGGLPAVAGDFAVNLALAGEAFLHGAVDEDVPGGERFRVYSTDQCVAKEGGWRILERYDSTGVTVGADDYLGRLWRKHRRWRELADAPMRALLDDCDNLLLLKRVLRATSSSRIHGGILRVPSELEFPQRSTDPTAEGQSKDSPFMENLAEALTTPIQDPSSPNSVVPLEIKGPADVLEKLTWLDLGRGYGQDILKEIAELTKGIAVGLDLPVEVVTGMGDSNHWSAWQISEETFKAHIEPLVQTIVRGLTEAYLWPLLRAQSLDPAKILVWYDPAALVGHDNLFDNMTSMHTAYVVSDAALRRAGGATEDDEPDAEEIKRRLYIAQQQKVTIREAGTAPPDELQGPADLVEPAPSEPVPPSPAATPQAPPQGNGQGPAVAAAAATLSALVAAAPPRRDDLGRRLMEIDRDLRLRIQTMADQTLQRALERAGSRVKGQLAKKHPAGNRAHALAAEWNKKVSGVPLAEIARHVGREVVQALGLREEELIDDECADLEEGYERQTRRATVAALLAARAYGGDPDLLPEDRIDELADAGQPARAAGFAVLAGAIASTAHGLLFAEGPVPPAVGELDTEATIPIGTVRDSLAISGGQTALDAETEPAGIAVGPLVMDAIGDALEIFPGGWQWVYGYPDREFEPHYQLEGVEFSSWEDDLLVNDLGWPDVDYFHPGDHAGCSCSYIPMFEGDRPTDEAPPEEG